MTMTLTPQYNQPTNHVVEGLYSLTKHKDVLVLNLETFESNITSESLNHDVSVNQNLLYFQKPSLSPPRYKTVT